LDVNMADTPAVSTPSAGQKRSREDDEGEEVAWDFDLRAEKVGFNAGFSYCGKRLALTYVFDAESSSRFWR
jgi:hypothetical protein